MWFDMYCGAKLLDGAKLLWCARGPSGPRGIELTGEESGTNSIGKPWPATCPESSDRPIHFFFLEEYRSIG